MSFASKRRVPTEQTTTTHAVALRSFARPPMFLQIATKFASVGSVILPRIKPLRQLHRRGVVKKLHEITAPDERTPVAVEIIGQVDVTKLKQ